MSVRAKVLRFETSIDADGRLAAEECPPLRLPQDWTAEHLLLAALLRCSLTSLRYHARRLGGDASGSGTASGSVTKRASDERYAFTAIEAELDVELSGVQADVSVAELLEKAERDCFIGASLAVQATYRWRVNGEAVAD